MTKSLLFLLFLFPSLAFALTTNHGHKLLSVHSGKCLDVKDHSLEPEARLQQWECTGENQQSFRFKNNGNDKYSMISSLTGFCVGLANAVSDNGSPVAQFPCDGTDNQLFTLEKLASGSYKLHFSHSNKCLDVSGPSVDNGALVHQWDCVAQDNQEWDLIDLDAVPQPPVLINSDVTYQIHSAMSGRCLDVRDKAKSPGARIQQRECLGEDAQLFKIIPSGSGYALQNRNSGLCVAVREESLAGGAAIQQWTCDGSPSQQVRFQPIGNYLMMNFAHSDKCLEIVEPVLDDGALALQNDCQSDLSPQQWDLWETTPQVKPRILLDNSDEIFANVNILDVPSIDSVSYSWNIYRDGQVIAGLEDMSSSIDLTKLGAYAGLELGATVVVNGQIFESENRIKLDEVVAGPVHSETITAEKAGLGLLGTPIVRRLNLTYETSLVNCRVKTVITDTIRVEECEQRPKDFSVEELKILRNAAITAFKSMMAINDKGDHIVTQCALKNANESHGEFSLAPGASLSYSNENASKVVENQLGKWDISGPIEDFNIHFRTTWTSKPATVIGHSNIGQVKDDYEHIKSQNTVKNRFEIHMSRHWLPPSTTTTGSYTWKDNKGNPHTTTTSMKYTASTVAHEMLHQMGISHTQDNSDPNFKPDFQDDFIYEFGDCVLKNYVSDPTWSDAAAF